MSDTISQSNFANPMSVGVVNNKADELDNNAIQSKQVKSTVESKATEQSIAEVETEKRLAVKALDDEQEQKAIEEVASKLQEFVNLIDKQLEFKVDDDSGRHVVTVSDKLSGDVIRQIPSEEVLRLARNLSELADIATRSGKILTTEV